MKHPAMNPYLPLWEYVPDGEPRIWGDRLYVYGSHDVAGSTQFCEGDYVVWSAPLDDQGSWKYEGISNPNTAPTATQEEGGTHATGSARPAKGRRGSQAAACLHAAARLPGSPEENCGHPQRR